MTYTTAQNGETRRYVIQTAVNAQAEIELPYFYTFQIGGASQPTKVEIYETRDDACPLGYRYAITNKYGTLTVLRNHKSDPLSWDFKNLVHYGRKPYEQWTIWALHQLSEIDSLSLKNSAQKKADDWCKNQLVNWLKGFNGLGHFRLSLVPSQSELIATAGACIWNSSILSRLMVPVPQFMRDHARAIRAGQTFAPTINQYLTSGDQLEAAQKLFNIYGSQASSLWGPSYDRTLYAYEWAFILAWLYGDLYIAGHPDIYEYRAQLTARKEKHPWSVLFSDGVGTVTAASAAEPWVAEVELSNPSVRRDPADSRQHVFQVTARQTAEQGQCRLFVQDSGGTPRAVVKMDKVSGSLATGAIFEKTLDLQERSYLVSPTTSATLRPRSNSSLKRPAPGLPLRAWATRLAPRPRWPSK